VINISLYI